MLSFVTILGVHIPSLSREDVVQCVRSMLRDGHQHLVVTPNPEFLLAARRSPEFKNILNTASLSLSDGVGLSLAALVKGVILKRWPGSDFPEILCPEAIRANASIFLLGGRDDVARVAADRLLRQFPALRIVGAESGGEITNTNDGRWQYNNPTILATIKNAEPDILLVALGQQKQEMWIVDHIAQLPSVKIAMGVGGMFDYISGRVSRAPAWLRRIGLEWLWRCIREPWRMRRIVNAVIIFPLVFLYDDILGRGTKTK